MRALSSTLCAAVEDICQDRPLSAERLRTLLSEEPLEDLIEAAHLITTRKASTTFNTCAIINAKADGCTCDCAWCAQSRHWNPAPAESSLVSAQTALKGARQTVAHGIGRYSLVTAGRKLSSRVCREAESVLRELHEALPEVELCASFGLMSEEELVRLKEAGLVRYHCNLETSDAFFSRVCSTHTREDKIEVLRRARRAGLDLCSGGLFGLGESEEDRIELAMTLAGLEIPSIPLNFLSPIAGTPLENQPALSDREILRTAVIFRFLNPCAFLRLAGGRNRLSEEVTGKLFYAGVNSAIMGDFLTTAGNDVAEDIRRARAAGYTLETSMERALEAGFPAERMSCRPTQATVTLRQKISQPK